MRAAYEPGRTSSRCSAAASGRHSTSGAVSHIIAVIHLAHIESWMHAVVHRWAMSIHRRLQSARGVDTAVTALLVDWRTGMELVASGSKNSPSDRPV